MTIQVQFDLKTREACIQKVLKSFKQKASIENRNTSSLLDDFEDELVKMDNEVYEAFRQLVIHHYLQNMKDLVNEDNLEDYQAGDIVIIGDVSEAKNQAKASIIGAFTNE